VKKMLLEKPTESTMDSVRVAALFRIILEEMRW
jgi:hypothetical protein